MKAIIETDANNYLITCLISDEGIELPEDFNLTFYNCYQYINENFILDEIKKQQMIDEQASKPSRLDQIEAQSTYTAIATDTLLEV